MSPAETPCIIEQSPNSKSALALPALIQAWRKSLGLQTSAQEESQLPEVFSHHASALAKALQDEGCSESTRRGIEDVFRTAVELVLSATNHDILSSGDTALSIPTDLKLHTQPSLSSLSELEAASTSEHDLCLRHAEEPRDKPCVGSMLGEREFHMPMEHFSSQRTSVEIYERFGGWDLFSGAVGEMYVRLSRDPRTARFFMNRPRERLMQHMTGFLSTAMLGRCMYKPEDLLRVHCPMMQNEGLGPEHVDVMCNHMKEVLTNLGATDETVQSAAKVLQMQKYIFEQPQQPSHQPIAEGSAKGVESDEPAPPPSSLHNGPSAPSGCPFAHAHSTTGTVSAAACPHMSAIKGQQ